MRSFYALVKKDLKGYFDQPTGYVLLVIFVGVSSYIFFQTALENEEASLRPLFSLFPWMLAIFVAASTMRLVAEEQRDGTLEILLTQPIRAWSVLFSKLVAALLFVGTGVVLTIGIPIALETAGDLDRGAVVAQYLGTFLLTASLVSIGLFTSSLTRNQIVAFILGLTIILLALLLGNPLITDALPSATAILVQDLSPLTHFSGIIRGVLDLKDVLYFAALISTFLSATYLMLRAKSVSHRSPLYRNLQLGVGGLVIISVLVGWFGNSIGGRWDLTEKKIYTLSSASKKVLADLDDIVTLELFVSKDPPVETALVSRDVSDFIDDVAAASNGKVKVIRKYPDEDEDVARDAQDSRIQPVQITDRSRGEFQAKLAYLGLDMKYANKRGVLPFIPSLDGFEYQVISNIHRMTNKNPKVVGVLLVFNQQRGGTALRRFLGELREQHEVIMLAEDFNGHLDLEGVDVIVIPGASADMAPNARDDIDKFLVLGGDALFLLDPVQVVSGDSPGQLEGDFNVFSEAMYLEIFGVRAGNNIVFDLRANEPIPFSVPGRFGQVLMPYPYFVRPLTSDEPEAKKISGDVSPPVLPWASTIEVGNSYDSSADIEATPLLVTSRFAGIDDTYEDLSVRSPRLLQATEDDLDTRQIAVAIVGTRCPPREPRCVKDLDKPFRFIVSTDSDFLNDNILERYPNNLDLVMNWMDWLTQDDALATIRSKGVTVRNLLFTSDTQRYLVQYGNIVGVPALIAILGILRFVLRRNATRKVYAREG